MITTITCQVSPKWYTDATDTPAANTNWSKHAVAVGGRLRDLLNDVPVLDHLAILKPVDIDNRKTTRARLAHGMIMDDHVIAVSEDVLDLAATVRKLVLQKRNVAL